MAVPASVCLDWKKMEVRRGAQWKETRELPRFSMWGLSAASGSTCDLPRILLSAWYLSDGSVDINRNREQPVEISRDILLLEKHIAWCWVNTAIKTLSQMLGDLLLEKAGRKQITLNWRRNMYFSHLSTPACDGSYSRHLKHLDSCISLLLQKLNSVICATIMLNLD